MDEIISSKEQMYRLLARGAFGNTTQQYFDLDTWKASDEYRRCPMWGVRSLVAGGPCRLYCPREEVEETVRKFGGVKFNVSIMVDTYAKVLLWADIWDSPSGLVVYGIEYPPQGGSWRALMPTQGKHYEGTAARMLLRRCLNENSYNDIEEVFNKWPGHVLELSACDRWLGVVPGRNHVVWELRNY